MTLYKYVVPERLDILASGFIRFTPGNALNDPFELRPYFESVSPAEEVEARIRAEPVNLTPYLRSAYDDLGKEVKEKVPWEVFLALIQGVLKSPESQVYYTAAIRQAGQLLEALMPTIRDQIWSTLGRDIGILSLSEANDSSVMWSYYADSHRGLILAFDENAPFFNRRRSPTDEFYHLRKVVYQPHAVIRSFEHLPEDAALLVGKRPEWSHEREWRMLAPIKHADRVITTPVGEVHLYSLPLTTVTGVIIGARASSATKASLSSLLASRQDLAHVLVGSASLDDYTGTVAISPMVPAHPNNG